MSLHKIMIGIFLCGKLASSYASEKEVKEDSYTRGVASFEREVKEDSSSISSSSLTYLLAKQQWLLDEEAIDPIPSSGKTGKTLTYFGNVAPTSLYRQEGTYFLPMAPVIYKYNPDFYPGYIEAAYELKPTIGIKSFFGKSDITKCFLIFQNIVSGDKQLLRLHGFVHGAEAGTVNANVAVAVELINHHDPVYFTGSALTKTDAVYCHGGVASPNNFELVGLKDDLYTTAPYWQSVSLYLPATKTAALLILGNNKIDFDLSEFMGNLILTEKFKEYFYQLLGKKPL